MGLNPCAPKLTEKQLLGRTRPKGPIPASILASSSQNVNVGGSRMISMNDRTRESSKAWDIGLFGCFNMQDAGLNCCVQELLCSPCTFGSAMEQRGNAADRDRQVGTGIFWCLGLLCAVPFLQYATLISAGITVADTYNVREGSPSACLKTIFCFPCYKLQIQNEIMAAEGRKLRFGCASVVEEAPGDVSAPTARHMSR